jgi:hypothetical protein
MLLAEKALTCLALAFLLSGCFWFDESSKHFLAGKYFTETSADTRTALYFDDSQREVIEPLVQNVSAIGVTSAYLVVRDETRYYLFVRAATTDAVARKAVTGPMDLHAFRAKLKQLSGDSTLQLSTAF